MATNTATRADVLAMLRGEKGPQDASVGPQRRLRPYVRPTYRCDVCERPSASLYGFLGNLDWSPEVPEKCPLRDTIRRVRREKHIGVVDVCWSCLDELRQPPEDAEPVQLSLKGIN